ncbi:hypothetical protein F5984_15165 [Rudanella paleaurantiibacter]|uniref:Tape measure protein N-terminal domain-containing protein n=1 Tax=Rudanella paleaurantiibacter TaxID=2614655 RepID=A0A7J5U1K8_9BACT|nr:tape measure protein [Rudanella paleaurantiibacter]KAB7730480.1 hypothetical protein F5984_15165 [Rudanella paleaurantiibacter]
MNSSGPLSFDAIINDTQFGAQIKRMEQQLMGLSGLAVKETAKMDSAFARLSQLAAGYFTFDALRQLPAELVRVRGEFQQIEIAFATMLGNKAKADKLVADLVQTAATTPFGLKDIAGGAKQLLAYGSNVNNVISEIRMLGDVASGVSAPINDLIYLYGTLRTQGRAYTVDIRQFAGRGIPIYAELAKVLGVSVDKVNGLVEAGKVGFPQVEQAFKNMTSGAGMFAGLMDAQSKSLLGLVERFKDAWAQMLNDIGKQSEGALGGAIIAGTELVENYEKVLDILQVLVITYGAYTAAVIAASVAKSSWTLAELAHFRALVLVEGAQKLLNRTMLANPYVAAATVLAGLIAAVVLYNRETTGAAKAQEAITAAQKQATEAASAEIAKIEVLRTQINNEGLSRETRNKKLKELIAISPEHLKALTLENAKTGEGTALINGYIESLKKKLELQQIEKELTDSITRQQQAKAGTSDLAAGDRMQSAMQAGGGMGGVLAAEQYRKDLQKSSETLRKQQISNEEAVQAKLKERINVLTGVGKAAGAAEGTAAKGAAKTVQWYDDQIDSLKKQQKESSATRAEFDRYQKQIDAYEKAKRRLTGEQTAAEKKAAKEADKVGPFGSISYWDSIAQKAQEIIDKTPSTNTAVLEKQTKIKLDAERRAEAIRQSQVRKSFEEELEEKRKNYTLYSQWVAAVDKQTADAQFSALLAGGQTYLDYLNAQIAKLEVRRDEGTINPDEAKNLALLSVERDGVTGKQAPIDAFRDSLQKARTDAKSLTDFLEVLRQKQSELAGNNTDFGIAARREVAEAMQQANAERKAELDRFLQTVVGSEEQRLAITKRYADLRAELEKQSGAEKGEAYQRTLNRINEAEKKEQQELGMSVAESTKAFRDLNSVIDAEGRKALQIRQQRLKAALDVLEELVGKESEAYKRLSREIKETGVQLDNDTLNTYARVAGLIGDMADALDEVNGGIGQGARLLSGMASQANNVLSTFKKGADETDLIMAGVQGLITLVDVLASSARERRRAEEDHYRAINAQQQQYNIALNEQLGLQTQLSESVFVRNFDGRLRDGIDKLNDANKGFEKAMEDLAGGKAKVGQNNAIDWNKVGKAAGAGAAVGGAIGTAVLPVIGTAIGAGLGAVYGGIAGALFGKKKKDEFTSLLTAYPQLIQKTQDGVEELNVELAKTLIANGLVDDSTKALLESTIAWSEQIKEAKEQIKSVISELAGGLGNELRDNLVGAFRDGEDAAIAFGDSVEKILEDLLSQMIFSRTLGPALKELENDLMASVDGGDNNWVDDFGRFFGRSKELSDLYTQGLKDAQDAAKAYGMDLFGPTDGKAGGDKSLSGAIKGVSEETASVLAGQINAIRIQQAETGGIIRQQLISLTQIEVNTRRISSIDEGIKTLVDIVKTDPLRAKGL